MNIIFLDIDGVLNSNFWNVDHQKEISDGKYIDTEKVKLLAKLVNRSDASIILHSGWRFWFDSDLKPMRPEAGYLESLLGDEGISVPRTDIDGIVYSVISNLRAKLQKKL